MATNIFDKITKKGTIADFNTAMDVFPTVWDKHTMNVASDAPTETYVWSGFLPEPREFIHGRTFQGIRDFTFDRKNRKYELTFKIDRDSIEDDRHNMINSRIADAAEAWATFKDSQFATLLINGDSATLGIDTLDGTAFYGTSRTIGGSGTIDNSDSSDVTTINSPTVAEFKIALKAIINKMDRFNDDQGRPFNAASRNQKRLIIPTEWIQAATETVQNTLTGGGDTNAFFLNLVELDELIYLTDADDSMYMSYMGAHRKPFIYQERTPLEILVDTDPMHVAKEDGVIVMVRQRYDLGYGDPRLSLKHELT